MPLPRSASLRVCECVCVCFQICARHTNEWWGMGKIERKTFYLSLRFCATDQLTFKRKHVLFCEVFSSFPFWIGTMSFLSGFFPNILFVLSCSILCVSLRFSSFNASTTAIQRCFMIEISSITLFLIWILNGPFFCEHFEVFRCKVSQFQSFQENLQLDDSVIGILKEDFFPWFFIWANGPLQID